MNQQTDSVIPLITPVTLQACAQNIIDYEKNAPSSLSSCGLSKLMAVYQKAAFGKSGEEKRLAQKRTDLLDYLHQQGFDPDGLRGKLSRQIRNNVEDKLALELIQNCTSKLIRDEPLGVGGYCLVNYLENRQGLNVDERAGTPSPVS